MARPEVRPAAGRAAVLLLVEAAALLALAGFGAYEARADAADPAAALGAAAGAALLALLLLTLAAALRGGRRWPRTPALVLQLLALPVGTDQLLGGVVLPGLLVLLLAGATGYHLLRLP